MQFFCNSHVKVNQAKHKKKQILNNGLDTRQQTGSLSPVNSALLFGYHGLEVGELKEAVVEVVQVENTHQQEGRGYENPGEKQGKTELLQAEVVEAA